MVFVVPRLKSPAVCEECVGVILRDSILTSLKNRSSVGYLLGLPVDIDSILINGGSVCLSVDPMFVYQCVLLERLTFMSSCSCPALRLYIKCSR